MDLPIFVDKFSDAIELEPGTLAPTTIFKQLDTWDSLCLLNTIAMIDMEFGVVVTGREIESCDAVADLYEVVRSKSK